MQNARARLLASLRRAGSQQEEMTESIQRIEKMKQGKKKPPMPKPGKGRKPY